jgi:hypothetical protein
MHTRRCQVWWWSLCCHMSRLSLTSYPSILVILSSKIPLAVLVCNGNISRSRIFKEKVPEKVIGEVSSLVVVSSLPGNDCILK